MTNAPLQMKEGRTMAVVDNATRNIIIDYFNPVQNVWAKIKKFKSGVEIRPLN